MRHRLLLTSLALSVISVGPACGGEDPPGSLIVPFVIGADVACSALGVTEVTVQLVKSASSGTADSLVAEEKVLCDDHEAEFTGVAPGSYNVQITGVDGEGVVIVDNLGIEPPAKAEITSGAQNTADEVVLLPTPARILVRWQLNGGFGMCSDVPVAEFDVRTFEKGGLSPLLGHVFACDPEEDPVEGYNLVLDPDRNIAGDDLDLITINALDDKGGDLVTAPLRFAIDPPGLGRTVKLTAIVNCDMGACTIACAQGKEADPMMPLECLPD